MIHASPRIKEGKNQLQTSNIVSCSEILKRCNGDIEGTRIFIFCDAFSLLQMRVCVDVPTDRVVAIIGDTHHGSHSLSRLILWLKKEKIKKVALKQTCHHKQIFEDMGFDTVQLPFYGLNLKHIKPNKNPIGRVLFFGSITATHGKRTDLIRYLIRNEVPLDIMRGSREKTFTGYNIYSISLNMPLNRDVNYRIYEIMASGGLCITEELHSITKESQIARSGENIATYTSKKDCLELIKMYLSCYSERYRMALRAYQDILQAKKKD